MSKRHSLAIGFTCGCMLLLVLGFGNRTLLAKEKAREALAVVTNLRGTVSVQPQSSKDIIPVEVGTQLFDGDRIKTGKKSEATIMLSNGNLIVLHSTSKLLISSRIRRGKGVSVITNFSQSVLSDIKGLFAPQIKEETLETVGGIRGIRKAPITAKIPVILSPRNTKTLSSKPELEWSKIRGFDKYKVKLSNSTEEIWSITTTTNKVVYPATAPRLEIDEFYFWRVEAEAPSKKMSSETVYFTLCDTETRKKASTIKDQCEKLLEENPDDHTPYLILGTFYKNNELYSKAIEQFTKLTELSPDSVLSHRTLGEIYKIVGLKDLAIEEYRKAIKSRTKPRSMP